MKLLIKEETYFPLIIQKFF